MQHGMGMILALSPSAMWAQPRKEGSALAQEFHFTPFFSGEMAAEEEATSAVLRATSHTGRH